MWVTWRQARGSEVSDGSALGGSCLKHFMAHQLQPHGPWAEFSGVDGHHLAGLTSGPASICQKSGQFAFRASH